MNSPTDTSCSNCTDTSVKTTNAYFNKIEVVQKYNPELLKEMSEEPAIFETEPKEDIGSSFSN